MGAIKNDHHRVPSRSYTKDELDLFSLLDTPIHIFDIEDKCMWWANPAGRTLWNADSLEELMERDFASDMSVATDRRLKDYLRRFEKGERIVEQWTLYPKGVQVVVNICCSGICLAEKGGRMAMLCASEYVSTSPMKEEADQESLRSLEMLREAPVAVSQFDISGVKLMEQNPEAMDLFGGMDDNCCSSEETKHDGEHNSFLARFLDPQKGHYMLDEVQAGRDCSLEAQQHTINGPCWFAIKVRQSRDPVTKEAAILYSARDISKTIEAMNEADRASMEKSEMLAVLSHEIRTPLHQVVGFIELLGQTNVDAEQSCFINALQTATISLMTIINDVLDYTKLEAGKMEIENIPFDPNGVCKGCIEVVAPVAHKRGLTVLGSQSNTRAAFVLGDPNRLRQILLNLLSNAVKFTHEGSVTLTFTTFCKQEEEDDGSSSSSSSSNSSPASSAVEDGDDNKSTSNCWLRFVVQDTGIGISQEQCAMIFDKFKQTDAAVARQYGGTGLGLSICKILAEAMGGTIHVESEVNVGSKFTLEIPTSYVEDKRSLMNDSLQTARLLDASERMKNQYSLSMSVSSVTFLEEMQSSMRKEVQHHPNHDDNAQDKASSNKNGDLLKVVQAAASSSSSSRLKTSTSMDPCFRILVAEDNKMNQKLLAAMLSRIGLACTFVENGLMAVEEADVGNYDFCLMDVQMPKMDGIEATKQIRKNGFHKTDLPIIGLTASFQSADLEYYQSIGMNDCIGKPVRLKTLVNLITSYKRQGLATQ